MPLSGPARYDEGNMRDPVLILIFLAAMTGLAQTASLRGRVIDESGAVIPGAKVSLRGPARLLKTVETGIEGVYVITNIPPGDYTIQATAPQLGLPSPARLSLTSGSRATLDLQLKVVATTQRLDVPDETNPAVSADAASNASAVVLKGKDLDALADNPEDLAADLEALAGPSAGPNGGAIYIDGFSGGQLPSKESIREIRINQNPFSAEYDKLGLGRIEIFTKPGSEKLRGAFYYNVAHDAFNTRNPYAAEKAPFLLKEYGGSLSGPINRHSAYFLDVRRDSIDNGAVINGSILDPVTLAIVNPYTSVFTIPQRRVTVTPRVDYQLNDSNTLTARYSFFHADVAEAGVGGFNLPSRAVHAGNDGHSVQFTETAVIGGNVVNETRFQFFRFETSNSANTATPALQVLNSFNGGGSPVGQAFSAVNNYEAQNYTTVVRHAHSLRFGVRMRAENLNDLAPQNFLGTFTFGGGLAPALDAANQAFPQQIQITSIERYQRTLRFLQLGLPASEIRTRGGGATQFTINAGTPALSGTQVDAGVFIGDDWRARQNLTLSLGLRYEAQSNIRDWRNLAPRLGLAWAPGAKGKARPKSVVRAGFGLFYDRFSLNNTLTARRFNGVTQQQLVVTNPDFFPSVPKIEVLLGSQGSRTIQQVDAALRAPYITQGALGFERQLPRNNTLAVTYATSHGVHMLRSRNINAPFHNGQQPYGAGGPILQMESAGLYNQNQLLINVNSKINKSVSLFGSYILNRANSNTDGLNTYPARQYSLVGEYGPAATDIHNRVTFGGSLPGIWGVRLSPLLTAETGPPFDITVGRDIYGTTLFNARPAVATDTSKPGLIRTSYGLLDPNPSPDAVTLSRNYGRGPGSIVLNLRITRTFAFGFGEGREAPTNIPGGGDGRRDTPGVFTGAGASGPGKTNRRYNVTLSLSVRNLLNHNNPGPIIGNLTSPLFGFANQPAGASSLGGTNFSESANNRRLEFQSRFTF